MNATLLWSYPDGRAETETQTLKEREGGILALRVAAARLRASGAETLRVTPDFGRARKGESGWWFSPYGYYGEWNRESGVFRAVKERMNMPMFGWATPRGAWLAVITSLRLYPREVVEARGGEYSVSCELSGELCRDPYEDFEIEFHPFPAGTGYAALARAYRALQLKRGAVRPLRERAAENPALAYAAAAPEIRIRQAWKPVPSPMPHQQPENEPPVHVAATFGRVRDISRALHASGVERAELCLVGWNIGGHDGRWPQSFPAEPLLGGDEALREAIAAVRADGYQIVPHGNVRDGYEIADSWDAEWVIKDETGLPVSDPVNRWGGGLPYFVCPQRAYERFATKDIPRMAALGFKGLGYFDVVSIVEAPPCRDPRHPCSRADSARWWGRCADISRRELGGFASEGAMDHFAGSLDSVLYASFDSPPAIEAGRGDGNADGLALRHVPIVQIVYNGIWLQNPFTNTVNFTVQERYWQLKLLEYGGRPNFYFHSKFKSDGANWMGSGDLSCATDDALAASAAKIKEGCDIWAPFAPLQFEFMDDHRQLAPGVFETVWSNGARLVVNYTASPFDCGDGRTAPPLDFLFSPAP
ncbi:MAG: hypothetical protein IJS46_00765 [Kiritimatiellae bacterium]|nr:hypothetical protein [Kiritimatiellia bacterium]